MSNLQSRLYAHCENPACVHSAELQLYALAYRYGPKMTIEAIKERLVCARCGGRKNKIHRVHSGMPAVHWSRDRLKPDGYP